MIIQSLPWIVPVVGTGFVGFGIGSITSIIFPYVGDCYREVSRSVLLYFILFPFTDSTTITSLWQKL